ncbi:MAG: hypothetical protein IPJ20_23735 [Flammeovirgaceae bacterium]|nr:hypothetical protein [Flammeovirgaceae bacterium]
MTEDCGEIKFRYILTQGKGDALSSEAMQIFPVSRWKIYLILVPTFIAVAFISVFYFSFFLCFYLVGLLFWPLDLVAAPETEQIKSCTEFGG